MNRKIKTIKSRRAAKAAFTLSQNCDNGEVLEQSVSNGYHQEYVVQSSLSDIPFDEYIVMKEPAPGRYPATDGNPYAKGQSSDMSPAKIKDFAGKDFLQKPPIEPPYKSGDQFGKGGNMGYKGTPTSDSEIEEIIPDEFNPEEFKEEGDETQDSFEQDMQSILRGEKAFDNKTKTVENRFADLNPSPPPKQKNQPESLDQLANQHAIFDSIAQSMEYAKAYDLGSIDLEKRFSDFDKKIELQQNPPAAPKPAAPPVASGKTVSDAFDHEDFLHDLSKITKPEMKSETRERSVQEVQSQSLSEASGKENERYVYESQSAVMAHPMSDYSYAQTPALIAGIAVADAIQIGLGAAAIVQSQVGSTQGSFSLTADYAQRLLTNEARLKMKGAQKPKEIYKRELFWIGELKEGFADASIVIEWEGNAYGEIGTAVIRRDILHSTEWTKSSANTTIKKIDRIPLPGTDPRTWPLVYTYEGTFDPVGNGYFEYSGEFEINAFGGLKFIRHEVVNRSLLEFAKIGKAEEYVRKGKDHIVAVPEIPKEQLEYLRKTLN